MANARIWLKWREKRLADVVLHRIEHAYRQSMPDGYGTGMGMGMMGGMGINNLPGSQLLLYGRGMYPVSWHIS